MRKLLIFGLLVVPFSILPLHAEPPPPEYFVGLYELVGRDAKIPPQLSYDHVRITAASESLALASCKTGRGDLSPMQDHHRAAYLSGRLGTVDLVCRHVNDGDNYALLTCYGAAGEIFTLWPMKAEMDAPLDCKAMAPP